MAAQNTPRGVEKKRKSKKRKARTEVSSSESSSESEVEQKKSSSPSTASESADSTPEPTSRPSKKEKKIKAKPATTLNGDVSMRDASVSPSPALEVVSIQKSNVASGKEEEEFDAIYIRKITTELADDLDKVREAQDFKANSIPMLIHALKQGEKLFTVEEKRRVITTSKA